MIEQAFKIHRRRPLEGRRLYPSADYIEQTIWPLFQKYPDTQVHDKATAASWIGNKYVHILDGPYRREAWAAPVGKDGKIRHNAAGITTVGIDVGGEHKGFHAVAITSGAYADRLATRDVQELSHWCRETMRARVIAIDAPCRWSKDGHSRPAERQLMNEGSWCFSTPTRARAVEHPGNHFGWMLRGEVLFQALAEDFPLCRQLPVKDRKYCFETFPHAITWHLRGGNADASQKRKQRRALLEQAGIDCAHLTNIDLIDAALCALTAYLGAMGGACVSYGEEDTGVIIVPGQPEHDHRPPPPNTTQPANRASSP